MQRHTHEWLKLNRRLFRAAEELSEKIRPVATKAQFECICYIFLERGARPIAKSNFRMEIFLGPHKEIWLNVVVAYAQRPTEPGECLAR